MLPAEEGGGGHRCQSCLNMEGGHRGSVLLSWEEGTGYQSIVLLWTEFGYSYKSPIMEME